MMVYNYYKFLFVFALSLCFTLLTGHSTVEKRLFKSRLVEIRQENGRYSLYYKGEPFHVKGGAVTETTFLPSIKAFGGNSVRTYTSDNAENILDSAHQLGLTVMLGIYIGDAYKDFHPDNQASRDSLKKYVKEQVLKYKDHPALMFWSLGNEVTLFMKKGLRATYEHILLWKYMDELVEMIHQLDPLHPVTTAIARRSFKTRKLIDLFFPNIDFLTFNSAEPLKEDELPYYNKKPFMIGELSAPGYWEYAHTEWYARLEPTSNEKSEFIDNEYKIYKTGNSLGSFAFIWGRKLEYSHTWFSLFTERGEVTETALVFKKIWGEEGQKQYRHGSLRNLTIDKKKAEQSVYLNGGKIYAVNFDITGSNYSQAKFHWELLQDEVEYLDASYSPTKLPVVFQDSVVLSSLEELQAFNTKLIPVSTYSLKLKTPSKEGAYRIFLYLKNVDGVVSTANICFYVRN